MRKLLFRKLINLFEGTFINKKLINNKLMLINIYQIIDLFNEFKI